MSGDETANGTIEDGITYILVGGLEPWNFMTFHIYIYVYILGIIIPTDYIPSGNLT
jgi:hypothetical protein